MHSFYVRAFGRVGHPPRRRIYLRWHLGTSTDRTFTCVWRIADFRAKSTIRHTHLQIEDALVSWGEAHHTISGALLDTLKNERQEMRKLIATLHERSLGVDRELTAGDRSAFAQTLLALARTLDSHVERYDSEVLPSILRALFPK